MLEPGFFWWCFSTGAAAAGAFGLAVCAQVTYPLPGLYFGHKAGNQSLQTQRLLRIIEAEGRQQAPPLPSCGQMYPGACCLGVRGFQK